jgi:hypothetical protein
MKRNEAFSFFDVYSTWICGLPNETAKAYGGALCRAQKACRMRNFLAVTEKQLREHVSGIASLAMQRRTVSALHSFFSCALDVGAIRVDPSRRIKLRFLTRESNAALLSRAGYQSNVTWGEIVHHASVRGRKSSDAVEELQRRLIARLRKCHVPGELRYALREKAGI